MTGLTASLLAAQQATERTNTGLAASNAELAAANVQLAQAEAQTRQALERAERANAELLAANAALTSVKAQLQDALEQIETLAISSERQRMAMELHDGVSSHLHAIQLQALGLSEQPAAALIHSAAGAALDELRAALHNLEHLRHQPQSLEELVGLLLRYTEHLGLETRLEVHGTVRPLAQAVRIALYRIVQEALVNIQRHAAADSASVAIDYRDPQALALTISDDGVGLAASAPVEGRGLRNIRERVARLAGRMAIDSAQGAGVQLWVSVPTLSGS